MNRTQPPAPRARLILALAFGLASGCVGAGQAEDPFGSVQPASGSARTIQLDVRNEGGTGRYIYLIKAEGDEALGMIARRSSQTFLVEWDPETILRVKVEERGGLQRTTNGVRVEGGDRVELIMPTDERRSYLRLKGRR